MRLTACRPFLFVTLVATLATVVMTWPLAPHAATSVQDLGDPLLQLWTLKWDLRQLARDPLRLYDANTFVPFPQPLAYSESMLATALLFAPLYWLTGNDVLAYNLLVLFTFAATVVATTLLARQFTRWTAAALLAGLAFAFIPYRFGHLSHLNLLSLQWLPLLVLCLVRYLRTARPGWAAGFTIAFLLQSLSSFYYAYLAAIACAVLLVVMPPWRDGLPARPRLLGLAAAGLIIVLVMTPVSLPYFGVRQALGFERTAQDVDEMAATPKSYIAVAPESRLYHRRLPERYPNPLFPGAAVAALAVIGLVMHRRRLTYAIAAVGVSGLVLSFGLSLNVNGLELPLPYGLLYAYLPGARGLRDIARFGVLPLLALSLLAAAGLGWLADRVAGLPRGDGAAEQGSRGAAEQRQRPRPIPSTHGGRGGASRRVEELAVADTPTPASAPALREKTEDENGPAVPSPRRSPASPLPRRLAAQALAALVCAVALAEYASGSVRAVEVARDEATLAPYRWLAEQPPGLVVEFPADGVRGNITRTTRYMYYATYHWQPHLLGYSGFVPRLHYELVANFPDDRRSATPSHLNPGNVGLLRDLGVRYLLFHRYHYSGGGWRIVQENLARVEGLTFVGQFGQTWVYTLDPAPRLPVQAELLLPNRVLAGHPYLAHYSLQNPNPTRAAFGFGGRATLVLSWRDAAGAVVASTTAEIEPGAIVEPGTRLVPLELGQTPPPGEYRLTLTSADPRLAPLLPSAPLAVTALPALPDAAGAPPRLAAIRWTERTYAAGETIPVALTWEATGPLPGHVVFFQLIGPDNQVWGQRDGQPLDTRRPADAWLPGETIEDRRDLPIQPDAPPGRYRLLAGLYAPATGKRLPIAGPDGMMAPEIWSAPITITARR